MKNQAYTVFLSALNSIFLSVLTVLGIAVTYLVYYELVSPINSLYLYVASLIIASSLKIAKHWEKAVVLRMGEFHRLKGPGLFLIIPIVERVNSYIDQRVRVTDTKAENTLTKDTVPLFVDATIYWVEGLKEKGSLIRTWAPLVGSPG